MVFWLFFCFLFVLWVFLVFCLFFTLEQHLTAKKREGRWRTGGGVPYICMYTHISLSLSLSLSRDALRPIVRSAAMIGISMSSKSFDWFAFTRSGAAWCKRQSSGQR